MNIAEVRRDNLKALINKLGGQSVFIARTGMNQGQVSTLTTSKDMGEKLARKIERQLSLPDHALDRLGGWKEDQMDVIREAIGRADWLSDKSKAYFSEIIAEMRSNGKGEQ
jgi:hypothetical protein